MSIRVRLRLLLGIVALALFAGGCNSQSPVPGDTASATAGAASSEAAPVEADSPCRLLTDAEVRGVFPDARPGVRDRSREQYGIRTCAWKTATGQFAVQEWTSKDSSADNEIRGLSEGFLDPRNPSAKNNVRFETIAGVGEQAMAVVETKDEQRGILGDVAVLVARHGNQILEIDSSDLPRSERATALQALGALGRMAVARL